MKSRIGLKFDEELRVNFQVGCKHYSVYRVCLLWNLIHLRNFKNVVKIKQVRIRHILISIQMVRSREKS